MVELRKLSFHFLPLEEMILSLLAHRWNKIKLSGHRIGFLIKWEIEIEEVQKTCNTDLYVSRLLSIPRAAYVIIF